MSIREESGEARGVSAKRARRLLEDAGLDLIPEEALRAGIADLRAPRPFTTLRDDMTAAAAR